MHEDLFVRFREMANEIATTVAEAFTAKIKKLVEDGILRLADDSDDYFTYNKQDADKQ